MVIVKKCLIVNNVTKKMSDSAIKQDWFLDLSLIDEELMQASIMHRLPDRESKGIIHVKLTHEHGKFIDIGLDMPEAPFLGVSDNLSTE